MAKGGIMPPQTVQCHCDTRNVYPSIVFPTTAFCGRRACFLHSLQSIPSPSTSNTHGKDRGRLGDGTRLLHVPRSPLLLSWIDVPAASSDPETLKGGGAVAEKNSQILRLAIPPTRVRTHTTCFKKCACAYFLGRCG